MDHSKYPQFGFFDGRIPSARGTLIDAGCYDGMVSDLALKAHPEMLVHAFDPVIRPAASELACDNRARMTLHRSAVGVADSGESKVFTKQGGNIDGQGFTLMEKPWFKDTGVVTRVIDLPRWMGLNVDLEGLVILKMDIEGSEFEVVRHMAENHPDVFRAVDVWFVDWHRNREDVTVWEIGRFIDEYFDEIPATSYHWMPGAEINRELSPCDRSSPGTPVFQGS